MLANRFFTASALVLTLLPASLLPAPVAAQRPPGGFPSTFSDKEKAWKDRQAMAASSLLSGLAWRPADAADDGAVQVGGGRLIDIEAVPGRPFSYYVAYAPGGVFRTDDNGASFVPLWDGMPSPAIGDLAVDPQRPERLWVASGASDLSGASSGGMGVYLSEDGGRSFRHAGLGGSERIGRIVVDPNDGKRIYAAVLGKLFTPGGMRGIYRSRDGGATWEAALDTSALPAPAGAPIGAADLAIDPRNSQVLYAATWQHGRRPGELAAAGAGSGIWKSEDGGDTWRRLEGGLPQGAAIGRIGLAVSSQPGVIYAAIDRRETLPPAEQDFGGSALTPARLRRMTREEFLAQDPEAVAVFLREYPYFETGLDARLLISKVERGELAPVDLLNHLLQAEPALADRDLRGLEVWRSGDGGASWQRPHREPLRGISLGAGHGYGQIRVAGDDPNKVYLLGRYLAVSGDGGKSWKPAAGDGLGDHQALYLDPISPRRLLLGSGARLAASYDGGRGWSLLPALAASERPPEAAPGWPRAALRKPPLRRQAQPPVRFSFHAPEVLYFAADQLYRSADRGASFTPLGPELGRNASPGNLPYGTATTFSESPRQPGLLWLGSDDGQVWVSENGGASWAEAAGNLPAERWVSRIEASRYENSRAYLTLDGSRDDDLAPYVYRTEDYGHTWIPIDGGLPAEPFKLVREDPLRGEVLYAGSDRGIYVSLDRGRSWQTLAAGLPAVPVEELLIDPREREIVATTRGRGAYRLDALPIRELPRLLSDGARQAEIFALPHLEPRAEWYRRREPGTAVPAEPPPELMVTFYSAQDGRAELTLLDTGGRPLRRLALDAKRGISAFRWDLLLDEKLALTAEEELVNRALREQAALDKEKKKKERKKDRQEKKRARGEDAPEVPPPALDRFHLARTPWAEALRLGRPLYVTPGVYTLEIAIGGATAKTLLRVDKPAPLPPPPGPPLLRD